MGITATLPTLQVYNHPTILAISKWETNSDSYVIVDSL